jgi:hypothetical protein
MCTARLVVGVSILISVAASSFNKNPRDHGIVTAGGGGEGHPTFVSDPGVLADDEGLHLFASNIFCSQDDGWYYSWDPSNVGACNIINASYGIGYAFSNDSGFNWEFAPGPVILPGPAMWDGKAVETPFPYVLNGTLFLFYSARGVGKDGKEFRSRYQVGVATIELNGRSVREAVLRDGALATKRNEALLAHNLEVANANNNNIQEPSAFWNGNAWEVYVIGLGLLLPGRPLNFPFQRVTGIYTLRYVMGPALLPLNGSTPGTLCHTDVPVNIIEVRPGLTEHTPYTMYYTTIVNSTESHHAEAIGSATSSDGIHWTTTG